MPGTNVSCDFIAAAISGNASPLFDNANAAIGVGDDSTAFGVSQTQLQAEANGSNALRKGMDSGFPVVDPDSNGSNNTIRFSSTFGTSEGNFRWEEWGVFNDVTSGAGTMLNRKVDYIGEKTNSAIWVFECDITFSV